MQQVWVQWSIPKNSYVILSFLGQPSNHICTNNDSNVEFSYSSLSHSAWEPRNNCSLSRCNISSIIFNACGSLSTSCFDYRTINNTSICAPAIQCSLLEPCDNITNECTSNTSVCVINSCCSTSGVCLPLSATSFCSSGWIRKVLIKFNEIRTIFFFF